MPINFGYVKKILEKFSIRHSGTQAIEGSSAERKDLEEENQKKLRSERLQRAEDEEDCLAQEEYFRELKEHENWLRKEESLAQQTNAPVMTKNQAAIQAFCRERRIHTLLHFTRIENLPSILCHGLLGRVTLSKQFPGETYIFNDDLRIDNCNDAVCLSIGFPNYRMFYRYRMEQPDAHWAVLLLRPEILWELDCAFCYTNAASNRSRFVSLDTRRDVKSFKCMFESQTAPREQLDIPDDYPTDPQAEVLVFESIHLRYIIEIQVEDIDSRYEIMGSQSDRIRVGLNEEFFEPRCDWSYWKNLSSHRY